MVSRPFAHFVVNISIALFALPLSSLSAVEIPSPDLIIYGKVKTYPLGTEIQPAILTSTLTTALGTSDLPTPTFVTADGENYYLLEIPSKTVVDSLPSADGRLTVPSVPTMHQLTFIADTQPTRAEDGSDLSFIYSKENLGLIKRMDLFIYPEFSAWAANEGIPAAKLWEDGDADGWPNYWEFRAFSNPTDPLSVPTTIPLPDPANRKGPYWWWFHEVVGDLSDPEHNKDIITVGQAKWMVERALTELRFHSESESNTLEIVLNSIVSFEVPQPATQAWIDDQYSPVTIGQLKALAKPFYEQLGLVVPWAEEGGEENFEVANVGQLKHLFRFDFFSSGVAYNCGGSALDAFESDLPAGGNVRFTTNTIDISGVTNPAPQAVYQSQRYGASLSYLISDLEPDQAYILRLHFADWEFTSLGQRVFDVTASGVLSLDDYDVIQQSGGQNRAVIEELQVTADSSGTITLELMSVVSDAIVNGIEVISNDGTLPVNLTP